MIILNTNLTKEDYKFASNYLRILLLTRDKKETKDYEKHITPLAESGQVEAMELYCKNLMPVSTFNSKIVTKMNKLENKPVKEPRDYMTLYSYYNWYVEAFKYNYKTEDITKLEKLDAYKKSKLYYNTALSMLERLKEVDPIAKEWLYKLSPHPIKDEEYLRDLSNLRNKIYEASIKQVNMAKKLKLQFNYAINVIDYASDNEYHNKWNFLARINSDLQKYETTFSETRRF